jgi:alkanesulfonate monooxygenase SsuD/methylene tetrahydromethanopterin reductase-like flavin-dependent oxidoreductase (luciferase family)
MEQIICAEGLGFHIAWLAELHFCRPFAILSSPLILAAALAQRTRRIRLGSAVVLLPLQHPLRVAEARPRWIS